ncbi:MAG: LacI family DNA-binding transcriptional regulator [Burkholderiales bacterium]|nr:LacI family DNA-binding transcriptional regulator [Phycisphaerae bacterium]
MSVTLIANKAGVSIATVSRVLNNSRPVNPRLAELVHNAVRDLKIAPKPARRRIRTRSTQRQLTVALVAVGSVYREWFEMPVIAGVVAELTAMAQNRHMSVLITEMPDPRNLSQVLRRPDVSGAFAFVTTGMPQADMATLRQHMPVVRVMGGAIDPSEIDQVCPDNVAVGSLATKHFLDLGIRELAFVTSSAPWDLTRMRALGFTVAAHVAGITPTLCQQESGSEILPVPGANMLSAVELVDVVRKLLQQRRGRMGIFVPRDLETVDIYRALSACGARIGEDVVVVSCDNENPRLASLHPRPASIDLGAVQIAHHAVTRLAERIEHPEDPPIRIMIQPKIILGDS